MLEHAPGPDHDRLQGPLDDVHGHLALLREQHVEAAQERTAAREEEQAALAESDEYGFFANVNPAVDHPRWSQASERRIGEFFRRKTLPFNGYADQVASLYTGMDLRKFY